MPNTFNVKPKLSAADWQTIILIVIQLFQSSQPRRLHVSRSIMGEDRMSRCSADWAESHDHPTIHDSSSVIKITRCYVTSTNESETRPSRVTRFPEPSVSANLRHARHQRRLISISVKKHIGVVYHSLGRYMAMHGYMCMHAWTVVSAYYELFTLMFLTLHGLGCIVSTGVFLTRVNLMWTRYFFITPFCISPWMYSGRTILLFMTTWLVTTAINKKNIL